MLRLLEIIRQHSEASLLGTDQYRSHRGAPPLREQHGPEPAVAAVMKLSFEDEHRNSICELGGLQAIGEILAVNTRINSGCGDSYSATLRKYAGMTLINLTFRDGKSKRLLCSMPSVMGAVIKQLEHVEEEDLVQVFAGIVRNISWRADDHAQKALECVSAVNALMTCIQRLRSEVSIKTVLSAVWNLSAHSSQNKEEICSTTGSLKFLAFALNFKSQTKSLTVTENAGGILRNISSHIAINAGYRAILRQEGCLQTLVAQLRSPSTRVVSNACGVLWNLSARCIEDQELLWEFGAVSVLKTLVHSKHKSISASSASALRNLLAVKPGSSGTDTESLRSAHHHRTNSLPYRRAGGAADKKYKTMTAATKKKIIEERRRVGEEDGLNDLPDYNEVFPGPEDEPNHREEPKLVRQDDVMQNEFEKHPPITEQRLQEYDKRTSEEMAKQYGMEAARRQYEEMAKRQSEDGLDGNDYLAGEKSAHTFLSYDSGRIMPRNRMHRIRSDSSSSNSSYSGRDSPHMNQLPFLKRVDEEPPLRPAENTQLPMRYRREQGEQSANEKPIDLYQDSQLSSVRDELNFNRDKLTQVSNTPQTLQLDTSGAMDNTMSTRLSNSSVAPRDDEINSVSDPGYNDDCRISDSVFVPKRYYFKQRSTIHKTQSIDAGFNRHNDRMQMKSHFEVYSMAHFPDRVVSDQCLSHADQWVPQETVARNTRTAAIFQTSCASCDNSDHNKFGNSRLQTHHPLATQKRGPLGSSNTSIGHDVNYLVPHTPQQVNSLPRHFQFNQAVRPNPGSVSTSSMAGPAPFKPFVSANPQWQLPGTVLTEHAQPRGNLVSVVDTPKSKKGGLLKNSVKKTNSIKALKTKLIKPKNKKKDKREGKPDLFQPPS